MLEHRFVGLLVFEGKVTYGMGGHDLSLDVMDIVFNDEQVVVQGKFLLQPLELGRLLRVKLPISDSALSQIRIYYESLGITSISNINVSLCDDCQ